MFAALAPADLEELAKRFVIRRYPRRRRRRGRRPPRPVQRHPVGNDPVVLARRRRSPAQARRPKARAVTSPTPPLGDEPIMMSVVALEDLRVASIPMVELREAPALARRSTNDPSFEGDLSTYYLTLVNGRSGVAPSPGCQTQLAVANRAVETRIQALSCPNTAGLDLRNTRNERDRSIFPIRWSVRCTARPSALQATYR